MLKVTAEYNLDKLYPELTKEWQLTKNKDLKPDKVTPGSHLKVWWRCGKGHEWKASIYNRIKGRGCPRCFQENRSSIFRKAAVKRSISLAINNLELSKEWHPTRNKSLSPYDVTPGSGKKVWWICNKGHEWKASIDHRARGRGCPYCSGRKKI